MAAAHTALHGRSPAVVALAVASLLGFTHVYAATAPAWLRHALHRPKHEAQGEAAAPPVGRYVIDEGGVFILDRTSRNPLIKFNDSSEVWVLFPSRAPRGDTLYKNDMGETVLRATRLGGMTVFTSHRPGGSAAAFEAGASPLKLAPLGPRALYDHLYQASVRYSRAAQHLIDIDALDIGAASDGLVADAAVVTDNAMTALSARPEGKALLARVVKVAFVEGDGPDVSMRGGILTVTVAAAQGLAGRPSSERIGWAILTPASGKAVRETKPPSSGKMMRSIGAPSLTGNVHLVGAH